MYISVEIWPYICTRIREYNITMKRYKYIYIYIHNSYLFVLVLPVQLLRPTFPPCSSKSRVQEIDKSSRDRLVHTRQDRRRNFQDPIIQGLDSTSVGADGWISKWLRFTLEILEKVAPSLGALSLSIWYLCISHTYEDMKSYLYELSKYIYIYLHNICFLHMHQTTSTPFKTSSNCAQRGLATLVIKVWSKCKQTSTLLNLGKACSWWLSEVFVDDFWMGFWRTSC